MHSTNISLVLPFSIVAENYLFLDKFVQNKSEKFLMLPNTAVKEQRISARIDCDASASSPCMMHCKMYEGNKLPITNRR